MSVPAREQRVLDEIETILQAGEARLASMFALFARLARDDAMPRTEELATRSRWSRSWRSPPRATGQSQRDPRRRSNSAAWRETSQRDVRSSAIMLLPFAVAAIVAAVLLSVSITGARACGLVSAAHSFGPAPSRAAACPPPRPVPAPARFP